MATSVLDVRSAFVPPRVVVAPAASSPAAVRTAAPLHPRLPLTVLTAAVLAGGEALGLLAVGLTRLDGLLVSATRPHGGVVAAVVLLLAGWVVAAAGSGATMVDGAGRRGFVALAHVELVLVAVAGVAAVAVGLPGTARAHLPALVLMALAVPVAKLLLAGSPSARAWIAAGPRVRERRPDPVARHRLACTLTVAAIGLGLGAVAVAGPQPEGPGGVGAAATSVTAER